MRFIEYLVLTAVPIVLLTLILNLALAAFLLVGAAELLRKVKAIVIYNYIKRIKK